MRGLGVNSSSGGMSSVSVSVSDEFDLARLGDGGVAIFLWGLWLMFTSRVQIHSDNCFYSLIQMAKSSS